MGLCSPFPSFYACCSQARLGHSSSGSLDFSENLQKILDKKKEGAIISIVYFIKLNSFYNVLHITKQISFYTILLRKGKMEGQIASPEKVVDELWLRY